MEERKMTPPCKKLQKWICSWIRRTQITPALFCGHPHTYWDKKIIWKGFKKASRLYLAKEDRDEHCKNIRERLSEAIGGKKNCVSMYITGSATRLSWPPFPQPGGVCQSVNNATKQITSTCRHPEIEGVPVVKFYMGIKYQIIIHLTDQLGDVFKVLEFSYIVFCDMQFMAIRKKSGLKDAKEFTIKRKWKRHHLKSYALKSLSIIRLESLPDF